MSSGADAGGGGNGHAERHARLQRCEAVEQQPRQRWWGVAVRDGVPGVMPVRDGKAPGGPRRAVRDARAAFVDPVRRVAMTICLRARRRPGAGAHPSGRARA